MINWKKVEKTDPPKDGKFLFFFDGDVYTGWPIYAENGALWNTDDEGYPLWETSEKPVKVCANVRHYAKFNAPTE